MLQNSGASNRGASTGTSPRLTWLTYKGDAQRTGASNVPVKLPLSLQWRYSSDAETGPIQGSPLVIGAPAQRRVIFNAGRSLFCLDAESGEKLWEYQSSASLKAPLTLLRDAKGGEYILAQASTGTLTALRATNGTRAWTHNATASTQTSPLLVSTAKGTRIVIAPSSGTLVALTTAGTVDPSWRVTLSPNGVSPASSPVLNAKGDRLFIAGRDQRLYTVDVRSARVLFSTPLGELATMSPVVVGNIVAVGAGSTALGVRVDNGSVMWRVPLSDGTAITVSARSLANGSGVAYFGTSRGALMAVDTRTGRALWTTKVSRSSLSGSPLVLPNVVLVGGRDGVLYGVDSASGRVTWRYRLNAERRVAVPTRVFVASTGTSSGSSPSRTPSSAPTPFSATSSSASATPTPTYQTLSFGVSSAPAAVDGQLFVPVDNASLYAFSTQSMDASPPRIEKATIVIPSKQGALFPIVLAPEFPGIPPKGPVSVTMQLEDAGSGIDPARIQASFDQAPVASENTKFDPATGLLTLTVFKAGRGVENALADGMHTVAVDVTDYNGNSTRYSTTFAVNKNFVQPDKALFTPNATPTPAPPVAPQNPWGGWRRDGASGAQTPPWGNGPPPWRGQGGRDGSRRDQD
jgi:outer membrane protein assembly factor BamB